MQLDFFNSPSTELSLEDKLADAEHVRQCYVCDTVYPWTSEFFYASLNTKSGDTHLKGICKDCDKKHVTIKLEQSMPTFRQHLRSWT